MTVKKTKPVLETLCKSSSSADKVSKNEANPRVSTVNQLKTLSWPSALPNPGKFIDFGDTPLSSSTNANNTLTESQKAADWANSPIVSSLYPPKASEMTPRSQPVTEVSRESDAGRKSSQEMENMTKNEVVTAEAHVSSYIGSFPPPPPPPMYKMTANGEQICTQSELVGVWDRWYTVTEQWWTTFPNYPPPPRHPNEVQDQPYTLEQWYRRVDFWWSYMQAMYFSPGNVHNMPAPQYVMYILDRACVGS